MLRSADVRPAERGRPARTRYIRRGNLNIPHSRRDQLEAADAGDLYDAYRLVVAYLLSLDARPVAPFNR